jgi:hypothetical protein
MRAILFAVAMLAAAVVIAESAARRGPVGGPRRDLRETGTSGG